MSLIWKRSEIRTKVRDITGLLTTEDMSDNALNDKINDYYRNVFALEVHAAELEDWFTRVTAAEDGGEYTISGDYLRLMTPMTTMDPDDVLTKVRFYQDKDTFFALYPEVADPTEARPAAALVYGGTLYLRPEPDGVYTFRAACIKKPDELSADDSVPPDVRWGPCIAYGVAIEIKMEANDIDAAADLTGVFSYFARMISRKKIMQKSTNQRAVPRF